MRYNENTKTINKNNCIPIYVQSLQVYTNIAKHKILNNIQKKCNYKYDQKNIFTNHTLQNLESKTSQVKIVLQD